MPDTKIENKKDTHPYKINTLFSKSKNNNNVPKSLVI